MSGEKYEKQSPIGDEPDALPRLIVHDDDSLLQLLRFFQRLLVRNPEAVRATLQAFVAEGHRFASTPEGHRWKESLADSALVKRGRLIWQSYGLDSLLSSEAELIPSDWLDYLINGMTKVDLEIVLSQLMMEGA